MRTFYEGNCAPIWRFHQAIWNDFSARMDWCVKPFTAANRPPLIFPMVRKVRQGNRTLTCCQANDLREEADIPAGHATFHGDAFFVGVLL